MEREATQLPDMRPDNPEDSDWPNQDSHALTPAKVYMQLVHERTKQAPLAAAIQRLQACAEQGMIGVVLPTDDKIDGLTCEALAAQGFTIDQVEIRYPDGQTSTLIAVCW